MSIGEHKSKCTCMTCGVPQGSILAPFLFSLYMFPLSQIMTKNQIAYHSYADDTQIYLALSFVKYLGYFLFHCWNYKGIYSNGLHCAVNAFGLLRRVFFFFLKVG